MIDITLQNVLTVLLAGSGAWLVADRRVTKLEVEVHGLKDRVEDLEVENRELRAAQSHTQTDVEVMKNQLEDLCERVTGLSGTVTTVGGQLVTGLAEIQRKLGRVPEA